VKNRVILPVKTAKSHSTWKTQNFHDAIWHQQALKEVKY
jgi:hypothetical protein